MTEERVTKSIMEWLEKEGWSILSYDFPQSGTGTCLQPNITIPGSKNQDTVIPDIVAYKGTAVAIFENKTNFSFPDVQKLFSIKSTGSHSLSLKDLLTGINYQNIFYGLGLHKTQKNITQASENKELIDFIIVVNDNRKIEILYDPYNVFL